MEVGRGPERPCRIVSEPGASGCRRDGITLVCPWLSGLPEEAGIWLSALSIHDCNTCYEGAWTAPPDRNGATYFAVYALDRLRSDDRLFSLLRERGVEAVTNCPSTTFFDGSTAGALDALGLDLAAERRFLAQARAAGFRTATCLRDGQAVDAAEAAIVHAGPGTVLRFFEPRLSAG